MATALVVGTSVTTIAAIIRCSVEVVSVIGDQLHASGLWTEKGVNYANWLANDGYGYIRFLCDFMVAKGELTRTTGKGTGDFVYGLATQS